MYLGRKKEKKNEKKREEKEILCTLFSYTKKKEGYMNTHKIHFN